MDRQSRTDAISPLRQIHNLPSVGRIDRILDGRPVISCAISYGIIGRVTDVDYIAPVWDTTTYPRRPYDTAVERNYLGRELIDTEHQNER
jgi:hypothetical protein